MRPRVVWLLEPWLGTLARHVVPGYTAMLVIACLVGTLVVVDETSRAGYARSLALRAMIAAYVAGLAGAGTIPLLQGAIRWWTTGSAAGGAGFAAYGGILGGLAGTGAVLWRAKAPVVRFLDAGIPAVGAGYFVARIGCFLAGCDYGEPTSLPVAIVFPAGSHAWRDHLVRGWIPADAPMSLPVHPTQLYMALSGLLLYLVTKRMSVGRGDRFTAFMGGYAALRFVIELVRGDASRGSAFGVTTSQGIAIAVVIALAAWRARAWRARGRRARSV
jgi:phosphatidylglycerol:prolipoprotein diacylglycerol transferase